MPEPEILTDPNQMLLRALAAKDAEIERLDAEVNDLRLALTLHHPLQADWLLCPHCDTVAW